MTWVAWAWVGGYVDAWVACQSLTWVAWVAWVAWVHKILVWVSQVAWVKKMKCIKKMARA